MSSLRLLCDRKRASLVFLIFIPLALFFAMRAKLSWRPHILGRMKGEITALAWSPDGQWLACASGNTKQWNSPDTEIAVWALSKGKREKTFKIPATLQTLRFSPDGQELVAVDISQKLRRWDWQKQTELASTLPQGVLALSEDTTLVAVKARGGVSIQSVRGMKKIGFLKDPIGIPIVAAFSPNNKKLALFCAQSSHIGHAGNSLQTWEIANGNQPNSWTSGSNVAKTPFALRFWPDEKSITKLGPGSIIVENRENGFIVGHANVYSSQPQNAFTVIPFAFNQNYATWYDPVAYAIQLQQWPSQRIERQLSILISPSEMQTLAFSPDGATLAGGDDKGFITLWRIK